MQEKETKINPGVSYHLAAISEKFRKTRGKLGQKNHEKIRIFPSPSCKKKTFSQVNRRLFQRITTKSHRSTKIWTLKPEQVNMNGHSKALLSRISTRLKNFSNVIGGKEKRNQDKKIIAHMPSDESCLLITRAGKKAQKFVRKYFGRKPNSLNASIKRKR